MDPESLAVQKRAKSLQTIPNVKTNTKTTKSAPLRSKSANQITSPDSSPISPDSSITFSRQPSKKTTQKEALKSDKRPLNDQKTKKEEPKLDKRASNGRYSCFCLDIGLKSYDSPESTKKEDKETDENDVENEEFTIMKDYHSENFYKIFKQYTNLTLPIFKVIASYFFFFEQNWLMGLEQRGYLINKFTWVTGTKRGRRVFICLGMELDGGLSLSDWYLYWIVPGKPQKKRRRMIPLRCIETISAGKNTPTFEHGDGTTADANRCLSISFLHTQYLPKTKIQRTFLRTLDLEFQDNKVRNQFVRFLRNFLWIYKS